MKPILHLVFDSDKFSTLASVRTNDTVVLFEEAIWQHTEDDHIFAFQPHLISRGLKPQNNAINVTQLVTLMNDAENMVTWK